MISTKKAVKLIIASVISGFSLTACGGYNDSVNTVPMVYYDNMYASNANQQYQQQAANPCCPCTCQQQNGTSSTVTNNQTNTVTTPAQTTTTPPATSTGTTPIIKPATPAATETVKPPAATTPVVEDAATKGRKILDKVMGRISAANALEAEIDKYEKNLKDGSSIQQGLKFWAKKPGSVKLEITSHSAKASNVGAKVTYVVGTGKATVRPGGALSFITKEMDQNDSNITSPNDYTPEQVDFFSMVKRLSSTAYKAELTGKTNINGVDVYLLTVTTSGTNGFDSRITKETIGFDPKTFDVKLWEAYTADSAEAYFRINIKSLKILSDLPDSTFKV